ncbi:MAG: diguanylate cyclase [Betaproteobacteria bacterium]|nr:diguanylate cyclase [Betaproteobacteria bacterium]
MNRVPREAQDRLANLVGRVALAGALLVAFGLPLVYAGLTYRSHSQLLETVTYVKATAVTGLVSRNPEMWMYQIPRLEAALATHVAGLDDEATLLWDQDGRNLASVGMIPDAPVLSRRQPIFESGRVVGSVEVVHSYRADLYGVSLMLLLGVLSGLFLYAVLKVYPLRVLRRVTAELTGQQERYALAFESAMEGYMLVDSNGKLREVNAALSNLTGYSREILLGLALTDLEVETENRGGTGRDFAGNHCRYETRWKRQDGNLIEIEVTVSRLTQAQGELFCLVRDITDRKRSEETIWFQANFDALTGLPNRRMFLDRLELELKKAHRVNHGVALLFIDLDDFKHVNDTFGHDRGDQLLAEAARRISECVRETDTVARLGGDEFVIVLVELGESQSVSRIAQNILQQLARPFQLGSHTCHISGSIGIAIFPNDGSDGESLLKNADQAMYVAKRQGRNRYCYTAH